MLKNSWRELENNLDILQATKGEGGHTLKVTELNDLIKKIISLLTMYTSKSMYIINFTLLLILQ